MIHFHTFLWWTRLIIFQDVAEAEGLVSRSEVYRREGSSEVAPYSPDVQSWSVLRQPQIQWIYTCPLDCIAMLPEGSEDFVEVCPSCTSFEAAYVLKNEGSRCCLRHEIDCLLKKLPSWVVRPLGPGRIS